MNGEDGRGVASASINEHGELVLTYSDATAVNLGVVVGADGKDGKDGVDGTNGKDGTDGKDGKDGAKGDKGDKGEQGEQGVGVTKSEITESGELVITYSDGTSANLGRVVGNDGAKGDTGEKGEKGDTGAAGKDGRDGVDGVNGKDGRDGVDGQNGADGKDGVGIMDVTINAENELVLTFSDLRSVNLGCIVGKDGADGKDGRDGVDGTNGADGKDGTGIQDVTISPEGALTMTLTNGSVLNLGNIKGADGIGILKSEINAAGELLLTYSDNTTKNLGKITGTNGANGADGVGIKNVTLSSAGDLSILMTDNSVYNLGNIKGEKGEKGDPGEKGEKGDKGDPGENGRGIAGTELVNGELVITYTDGTSDNLGKINNQNQSQSTEYLQFDLLEDDTFMVSIKSDYKALIEEVYIPSEHNGRKVTVIYSFSKCPLLKKVVMPDSIALINNAAFLGCSSLNDITFSNNLKEIRASAFYNCTSLTHLDLPQSLEKIGSGCFIGCTNLKELTIPENVNEIEGGGASQFENSGVTRVIFKNPNGWSRTAPTTSSVTKISSDTLSDPEKAYKLLMTEFNYAYNKYATFIRE